MTEPKRCPKCGAEFSSYHCETITFKCLTEISDNGYIIDESHACKDRQIKDLTERLETWRDFYKNQQRSSGVPYYKWIWIEGPILNKLRELGEIE